MGMSFHAEVSFMDGVEVPYTTLTQQRRAQALLPPAVTWIRLAGAKIYDLCRNGKLDQGRGFSLSRWQQWKDGFDLATRTSQIGMSLRMEAVSAVSTMQSIENSMQHGQS